MGLTVTVLLLVAAGLMCLGVGIGVALSRRERRAATSAADLAGLAGTDTAVPVLAALRSTVVVLDDDDEVLRASASAYTFNIVRDDAVIEPTVVAMVGRVRASGQAQDAAVTVARGRVPGAGQFHLQVELARARYPPPGDGDGRVLRLTRGPHAPHHRHHGRLDDGVVAHDVEGVGRRRGAQDLVVVIEDDDGRAQCRQHRDGRVGPGQAGQVGGARGRSALAPGQRDTDPHPQAQEPGGGKEENGDGQAHASRVVESREPSPAGAACGRAACGGVAGLLCLGTTSLAAASAGSSSSAATPPHRPA